MPTLTARLVADRLEVRQDGGFGRDTKSALQSVSLEYTWNAARSTWSYPYTPGSLQGLVDIAEALKFQVQMDPNLREQLVRIQGETEGEWTTRRHLQKFMDDRTLAVSTYNTQPIPPPWRHQQVAWHWAMRVRAMYLALDPGGGKTRIGADVIRGKFEIGQVRTPEQFPMPDRMSRAFKGEKARKLPARWCVRGGVLIVCPRGVISEWLEQLMRWQNIKGIAIVGTDAEKKRYRAGMKAWVHVCAYDSLESIEDNIYDGIIGDELHFIANEDSNRWSRMEVLRRTSSWVLGLSGTPIPNQLPSLWSQFYWLDGGRTLGPSYEAYSRKYFTKSGRKLEENATAESRITKAISRITMFLTTKQMFPDKAENIHQVKYIPLTTEQVKYYEVVRKQAASAVLSGTVSITEHTTRLLKLLQICQGFVLDDERVVQQFSSAKLKALEEMLTDKGDLVNRRVIVWCRFRHDIVMISEMLKRKNVMHMTWTGGMTQEEEVRVKTVWNSDHKQRVMVGMIQKGIGVNLHAPTCVDEAGNPARCSTTVLFGMDWKVTELKQAMARTSRGDQVETCLYRYLLSDGLDTEDDNGDPIKPIDVRIYEVLQEKLSQVERVTEGSIDYVRRLLGA